MLIAWAYTFFHQIIFRMNASVHFSIKFDGAALANHQMDVRELAPALIALSDLLEQASREAYPDAAPVRVNVQGNFKGGSFGVDLSIVQTIAQQIVSIFNGPEVTATANLLALLTGLGLLGSDGVIGLIKWLKGRKPSSIRYEDDRVIFELVEVEQKESFEVDLVAGRLYQSRVIRQSLAKVVKPLEREGIDTFAVAKDGATTTVVVKEDLPAFEAASQSADIVSDVLSEGVLLLIESPSFKDGNKWKVSDGGAAFFAEITDQAFIDRVNAGTERFGKGDVLIVNLRRIQSVTESGLRIDSIIDKVLEHKAPLQGQLFPR